MRSTRATLLAVCLTTLSAGATLAQGPGGPGGGGFGAFQKFRDQHKYTFQLSTTLRSGLTEMERSKSTQLKPAQAKQLLGVLTPLRKKPKLTQEEAKSTIQKVQKVFDARQLSAVDKAIQASQRRRGGGGPGGGPGGGGPGGPGGGAPGGSGAGRPGGGGPGGPGGPGGGRPAFDFNAMKNFNPLNPDKKNPRYERNKEMNDKLFGFLTARAAGKTATLDLPSFGDRRGPGGPGGGSGDRPRGNR